MGFSAYGITQEDDPVSQALRVAVTGKETGFGTFETLEILGKERSLGSSTERACRGRQDVRGHRR